MRRLAFVLVACAAFAAAAGATRQADPARNGLIAFSDDRNPFGGAVYAVQPDGRSRILLRAPWLYDGIPSPDGRRIMLSTRDRQLVADIDGGNVLDLGDLRGPTWSPDSRRILDATAATRILDATTGASLRDLGEVEVPVWSPNGRQIAYIHYPSTRLYVMGLAGGRPRTIPGTVVSEFDGMAWSPDGTRVAFVGGGPVEVDGEPSRHDVYVARIADREVTRVAKSERGAFGATWSPDGKRLVFSEHTAGGGAELVAVDADGAHRRTLTHTASEQDVVPTWSPDGKWIAFVRAAKHSKTGNDVFVVHPDGNGLHRITPPGTRTLTGVLTWTHDGRALVFAAMHTDHDLEIYAMRPDGGGLRPLTDNAVADTDPAWSPDGSLVAFVRTVPDPDVTPADTDLFVMRADGTGVRRVGVNPERDLAPAWSPDGSRIAFVRWDRGRGAPTIATIRPDGTGLRTLTARNVADWSRPAWSPDGREIAFATTDRGSNLYAIGADGSGLRRLRGVATTVGDPVWSPDGSRLAVTEQTGCAEHCRPGAVDVVRRDGTGARKLEAISGAVAWAPDGGSLVSADGAVTVLDLATSSRRVIADRRRAAGPSWQPACTRPGSPRDDRLAAGPGGALVCGLGGDDRIEGGPGSDRLLGGEGDDRIDAAGGGFDVVGCGAGRDAVLADRRDLVGEDCEQVTRH